MTKGLDYLTSALDRASSVTMAAATLGIAAAVAYVSKMPTSAVVQATMPSSLEQITNHADFAKAAVNAFVVEGTEKANYGLRVAKVAYRSSSRKVKELFENVVSTKPFTELQDKTFKPGANHYNEQLLKPLYDLFKPNEVLPQLIRGNKKNGRYPVDKMKVTYVGKGRTTVIADFESLPTIVRRDIGALATELLADDFTVPCNGLKIKCMHYNGFGQEKLISYAQQIESSLNEPVRVTDRNGVVLYQTQTLAPLPEAQALPMVSSETTSYLKEHNNRKYLSAARVARRQEYRKAA